MWTDPETETVEVVPPNRPVLFFGPEETVVIEELPGFGIDLFPFHLRLKRVQEGSRNWVGGSMPTKAGLTWELFLAAGKPDQRRRRGIIPQ